MNQVMHRDSWLRGDGWFRLRKAKVVFEDSEDRESSVDPRAGWERVALGMRQTIRQALKELGTRHGIIRLIPEVPGFTGILCHLVEFSERMLVMHNQLPLVVAQHAQEDRRLVSIAVLVFAIDAVAVAIRGVSL